MVLIQGTFEANLAKFVVSEREIGQLMVPSAANG